MLRYSFLGVVTLALALSLVAQALRATGGVAPESLAAAVSWLDEHDEGSHLIVVHPEFLGPVRVAVGARAPHWGRLLDHQDMRHFGSVYLLEADVGGAQSPWQEHLRAWGSSSTVLDEGGLRLTAFRNERPTKLRFDLYADLQQTSVAVSYADGVDAKCDRWERDRWSCPRSPSWSYVGRRIIDAGDGPRSCVWLHPVEAGGSLRVNLPSINTAPARVVNSPNHSKSVIPANAGIQKNPSKSALLDPRIRGDDAKHGLAPPASPGDLRLQGNHGFTADGRGGARAPVILSVMQGETEIERIEHAPGQAWTPIDVALPRGQSEGLHLLVSTTDNGAAHFCADLRIVETGS